MAKTEKGGDGGARKGDVRVGEVSGKEAQAIFDQLDRLHDGKEAKNAEYMADINTVYENGCNKLGLRKKVLMHEFKLHRAEIKRKEREAAFDGNEKEELDNLRDALGAFADTALGAAAVSKSEGDAAAAPGVH